MEWDQALVNQNVSTLHEIDPDSQILQADRKRPDKTRQKRPPFDCYEYEK